MRCPWISVKSRNSERLLGWRNLRRITARSLFAQWRRHQSTIGWYQLFYLVLPLAPFQNLQQRFMHSFVFSTFQSSSPMITSQTTCMVKRRGRYSFNTNGTVLKSSSRGGRAIIHSYWHKVARTFNITEGSIFAFHSCSFPDEIHLSIYRVWFYFPKVFDVACETWCCCVMS